MWPERRLCKDLWFSGSTQFIPMPCRSCWCSYTIPRWMPQNGSHSKIPQTRWINRPEMYSLQVQKPEDWSQCWQGYAPSTDSKEGSLLFSSSSGSPKGSLACRCLTPLSASIFTWPSPCVSVSSHCLPSFYKDTSHFGLRPTPLQYDLILT